MTVDTSLPTGTLTLFFSDLEGSTILLQALGEDYPAVLYRHIELIEEAIRANNGFEVSTHGDEVFAVFDSVPAAVEASVAVQRSLSEEPWPHDAQLRVRIGLHTGTPRLQANDYVGLDVHRAARISAAGNGGQVLLSKETSQTLSTADLPEGVTVREIGWHRLKDLRYPELLFDLVVVGLPSDFPPLTSLGQRPNNLREAQTEFVGRSENLRELKSLLQDPSSRIVTLTGIGGVGKTRLALAVGAEALDTFEDGVFQVPLSALREAHLVMPTIAQTLGVPEFPGMSIMDALKARLATSKLLLILDNFEQVVDAAPQIQELIEACSGLKAIVTSREALRVRGERVWQVPPLDFPEDGEAVSLEELGNYDSIRLFVTRASELRPDFELTGEHADAIRAICARLEGLPLAIELAASRVAVLSPEALLERLTLRGDVLRGGQRDVEPRHQTITNMIDWSYELLSESDRDLFEKLAVFSGSFTITAAEEICVTGDATDLDVLEGLESLNAKSLLLTGTVSGEPRLRMLEMIRSYAIRKLESTGGAAEIKQRHATHYAGLLEEMAPELQGRDQKEYVIRLLDDANNFRASLDWALESESGGMTGRIMSALQWFWIQHGWFTEALTWAERAVEQAHRVDSDYERAVIHDVVGWLKIFSGDYGGALPHCQESLDLFSKLENRSDIARTKMTLGITGAVTGEIEAGPEMIMEALAIYQELEDPVGIALALIALGEGARAGGDLASAEEAHQSAHGIVAEMGNVYWQSAMLHNLAHYRLHDGSWQEALSRASEALRLAEEYDYPMTLNASIAALGGVAVQRGDGVLAANLFGATDKLLTQLGATLEPTDLAELERNTAAAKELLSKEEFAAAFEDGKGWTLGHAMSAALEQS